MEIRPWLVGFATLILAEPSHSVVKTYFVDADQSTRFFASDQRIYRGDCDPNASTPNAGDDGALADDQCRCMPGVDCALGIVPIPTICAGGSRNGLNCAVPADCPGGACAPGIAADACGVSEGRPNGGSCDPGIAFPAAGSCAPGFQTAGSPEPPCNLTTGDVTTGSLAVIDDTGNGTPTLVSLSIVSRWDDVLGAAALVGIPGSTVALHVENTLGPAPNQTGTGASNSLILWGGLTGWTRSGFMDCTTTCPGGCGPLSACPPLGVVEGKAPLWPLKAGTFNTDPWLFNGGEFDAPPIEIVNLAFVTTEWIQLGGRASEVPLLPQVALAGLALGLAYLGRQVLRSRSMR